MGMLPGDCKLVLSSGILFVQNGELVIVWKLFSGGEYAD